MDPSLLGGSLGTAGAGLTGLAGLGGIGYNLSQGNTGGALQQTPGTVASIGQPGPGKLDYRRSTNLCCRGKNCSLSGGSPSKRRPRACCWRALGGSLGAGLSGLGAVLV